MSNSPLDNLDIAALRDVALKAAAQAIRLNENGKDPEHLDHMLNLTVQSLITLGQRKLSDVDENLSESERQAIYEDWKAQSEIMTRHIRMPHDFAEALRAAEEETLWDWAILAARAFGGLNETIEADPGTAEDRRFEAFDLMMRTLAHQLNQLAQAGTPVEAPE